MRYFGRTFFALALAGASGLAASPASAGPCHFPHRCHRLVGPEGPSGPAGEHGEPGRPGPPGRAGAPATFSPARWGVIPRNALGSPSVWGRVGPYGRTTAARFSATVPPPYGIGSLGMLVTGTERVDFGNETDFAGIPIRRLNRLSYWIFNGADNPAGIALPGFSIEIDPKISVGGVPVTFSSLNYRPDASTPPSAPATPLTNSWQRYDAAAAGSRWYLTGTAGAATGCTISASCSFGQIKASLPNAVISFSFGISKGRDNAFTGAVDGARVNNTLFDFEPLGVFPYRVS